MFTFSVDNCCTHIPIIIIINILECSDPDKYLIHEGHFNMASVNEAKIICQVVGMAVQHPAC